MTSPRGRTRGPRLSRHMAAAASAAAVLRHQIVYWREVSGGWRGACGNKGCQAHVILSTRPQDFGSVHSPTSLKRRCPYIVRNLRIKGRQRRVESR